MKLIVELPSGDFRPATKQEKAQAKRDYQYLKELTTLLKDTQKELNRLAKKCPHHVTYDTEGFPYNVRHCMKCGHTSLL